MASFTAGTTFTDGVANDVTAAKLGALVTNATPTSGFIQDRTAETVTATNDTLLIGDASDSNNLKRITVANFAQTLPTAKITTGTIETATLGTTTGTSAVFTNGTITNGTITTGVIPTGTFGTTTSTSATVTNLVSTTSTFNGAITGSTNIINIGSGQIYKDASGNIGIGTTSPGSIFHVANTNLYTGKLTFGGAAAVGTVVNNEATGNVYSEYLLGTWNLTRAKIRAEAGASGGDGVGGGIISLWTGAASGTQTERMRIDATGNVGIGTTSPSTKLNVNAGRTTLSANNENFALQLNYGSTANGCFLGSSGADTFLISSSGGAERLRIDSSGNVGIGTTSPAYKFVVSSSGSQGIEINPTSSTLTDIYSYNRATSAYINSQINALNLIVSTGVSSSTERLRIDSSGNVGIGTTGAVNKLEIVGSFGRGAPVTKTGDFTLADTENWIIVNKGSTCTVTLPAASSWTGREFTIKVITAHTVVSASSNVVQRNSTTVSTAILGSTAGAWATLVSNGTNWVIMCGS